MNRPEISIAIQELRSHLENMSDLERLATMLETTNGYCLHCGRKLDERRRLDGGTIVGDYDPCHCTNDE
jgi:hypothetical protein